MGASDPPTRRHAQVSRPVFSGGARMSSRVLTSTPPSLSGRAGSRAPRTSIGVALLAMVCATGAAASPEIGRREISTAPTNFDLAHHRRAVVGDASAATGLVVEQGGGLARDSSSLATHKTAALQNVEISLRLMVSGGKSDQEGGIALPAMSLQRTGLSIRGPSTRGETNDHDYGTPRLYHRRGCRHSVGGYACGNTGTCPGQSADGS